MESKNVSNTRFLVFFVSFCYMGFEPGLWFLNIFFQFSLKNLKDEVKFHPILSLRNSSITGGKP